MMVWAALKLVPMKVWASLAVFLAVLGLVWYVHHDGYAEGVAKGDAKVKKLQAAWDSERAQLYAAVEAEKARQAEVVTKTVIQYRDRVQVVHEVGEEIQHEIQVLHDGAVLSGAYRVLHDAAASHQLAADPGPAIAAAEPVEAAALLSTVAGNYEACGAEYEKLVALQAIVRQIMKGVSDVPRPAQ
jgi:hypothetical protein